MIFTSTQMASSLDNHAHDGFCVRGSVSEMLTCENIVSGGESEVLGVPQMEEYYTMDEFGEEGGFHCEEDDIMVEVLGSDVYVDGVCGEGKLKAQSFDAGVVRANSLHGGAFDGSVLVSESRLQGSESHAEPVTEESTVRVSEESRVEKSGNAFSVFDLVWVKAKCHQWWPGQILDPLDCSSEEAVNSRKNDSFLIVYFGVRTLAWHEVSLLKPFLTFFSEAVMQSSSEVFQNAVNCALVELSRQVQLGLSCPCLPKNVSEKLRYPIIVDAESRKDLRTRDTVDDSAAASSFKPEKLLEFINGLARYPSGEVEGLNLVISKAQLLCFYRHNGCDLLPEVQYCGESMESDADEIIFKDGAITSSKEISTFPESPHHRFRHNLKDITDYTKKQRSLAELMADSVGPPYEAFSSRKKHRVHDPSINSCMEDVKKVLSLAKLVSTSSSDAKPSFEIGDSGQRVASQFTVSLAGHGERSGNGECASLNGFEISISDSGNVQAHEHSSLDGLFGQLQFAVTNPLKDHDFADSMSCFLSDYRDLGKVSGIVGVGGGEREKSSHPKSESSEIYLIEDTNDSYWTDRIIKTDSQDQEYYEGEMRTEDSKKSSELERPLSTLKNASVACSVEENSAAELVLLFPEMGPFPCEASLNKTLKMFGPLKESETQVDRKSKRARVVFKKCSDAKVAFSSAQKYSIFGPVVVKYQLNCPVSDPSTFSSAEGPRL